MGNAAREFVGSNHQSDGGQVPLDIARGEPEIRPFVSVIIPCRNEVEFVASCLESVLGNSYPADRYEVLIIDGMSSDGTRSIVSKYLRDQPRVVLIDNPKKVTPAALNIGIAHARGDLIICMGAHATYSRDYITRCVDAIHKYQADCVGGITASRPRKSTKMGQAIAESFSHPFGAGNARYRTRVSKPVWVDTVFGACYRREVFEKVGLFNEDLVRSQDIEFSLRLKRAGGRTLLIPDAVAHYYIRSGFWSFVRHNWLNGVWAVLPLAYSTVFPVSWRHLVPLAFAGSLVTAGILGAFLPHLRWPFFSVAGSYAAVNVLASIHVAWRTRDPWKLLLMPLVFAGLHFPYGFGSLWGCVRTVWLLATGRASRGGGAQIVEAGH